MCPDGSALISHSTALQNHGRAAGAEVLQSSLSAVIYHGLLKGFKSDRADMINAQTLLFIHTHHSHFFMATTFLIIWGFLMIFF